MRTINYTVSYEKMISRLPAMFAYLEIDEQGTSEIVKATNGKQGDYGMIIANINYNDKTFEYECKDGTILKVSGGEKTYRMLIDTYYKAINDKEWERDENGIYKEPFLAFVERGIGLKYVGLSEKDSENNECGVPIKKQFPLAPDYIYLGEAKSLYNKMIQMKKQINFWENHTKICKEDKRFYQHLKEEYEMRNGDDLIDKLGELIKEAEDVAQEYLGYAQGTNLCLKFNVNLNNTIKDLGMVTPYIQEWVAGKRYYEEDVVYHIDNNGYGMTWYCKPNENSKEDEYGRKYTEGFYEDETELIFFDDGSTITIGDTEIEMPKNWYPQSLNWINRNEHYICSDCGRVYEQTKPDKCKCGGTNFKYFRYYEPDDTQQDTKIVSGTCNSHLASLRKFETYMNRYDEVETPDNYKDWMWYYRKGIVLNREEKYDELGNLAVMYGKEKGYADGVEAIVGGDNPTNIEFEDDGKTVINLAAWGDVITDIEAVNDRDDGGTITFTYWMGVHLKAKIDDRSSNGQKEYIVKSPFVSTFSSNYKVQFQRGDVLTNEEYNSVGSNQKYCEPMTWYTKDDDLNYKYYFKDFEADTTSPYGKNHGVKYTEKYIYYKGNTNMEVLKDFKELIKEYHIGDIIPISEYNSLSDENKANCKYREHEKDYEVINGFMVLQQFVRGQTIEYKVYSNLTFDPEEAEPKESNKKKCKCVEETIWTLVERGKFNDYIEGKFDKDYKPSEDEMTEEDTDAPYYYRLYDKLEFDTSNNLYVYGVNIGNRINKVPYLRTNFTTTIDITHVDIEERPLIRYDYYNGVSFQPSANEDVYVERGVTQAFEKYLKFGEIKTIEDLENYANGGFFVISKEDIDLG